MEKIKLFLKKFVAFLWRYVGVIAVLIVTTMWAYRLIKSEDLQILPFVIITGIILIIFALYQAKNDKPKSN